MHDVLEIHSTIVRKFFSGSPDCKRHYPVMTLPAAGTPALVEDEIAEELGCGLQRLGQQLAARLDGRANLLLVVDVAAVGIYTRWEKTGTDYPTGVGVQLKATYSPNGWESGGKPGGSGDNHNADSNRQHGGVRADLCRIQGSQLNSCRRRRSVSHW